ncbi:solute carrier family 35 member F5 isoform X2 [Nematostella vectensis]|uniref:solute carrier family 35 member F5 isoform X2 n=1 Tax=Nematostella vectensis TaxID=45351 RepID=UPI0020776D6F|nr:solute carrier family 35 member F5 isoform X2 [Nematostella vectensis]
MSANFQNLPACCSPFIRFLFASNESMQRKRRLALGVMVLLLVNIIWVASAELSDYIFHTEGFNKPFFTTYFKTSAFVVYLLGFVFYHPWQIQCWNTFCNKHVLQSLPNQGGSPSNGLVIPTHTVREGSSLLSSPTSSRSQSPAHQQILGESVFEPVTDEEVSQDNQVDESSNRHVHFNSVREVRHLQDNSTRLARMSHEATEELARQAEKMSLLQVAKIALMFCILWFLATWSYQEALNDTSPAAVNILSSSSGLFTLLLASVFKSSAADKFTVSKLVAVIISLCGIVMVTLSDANSKKGGINYGAIWSLLGAVLYACYLVLLKRKVPDETKMDITMFFGFVGAMNILLLWPGFFILHYSGFEAFELPRGYSVWGYLTLNAFIGTVLSEFLWLWGCFLTSSLAATLSLSLVIPLTMLVDVFMNRVKFSLLFLLGTLPVFASFFAVSLLTHYPDWDPVMDALKRTLALCTNKHTRVASLEGDESENLLNEEESSENHVPT